MNKSDLVSREQNNITSKEVINRDLIFYGQMDGINVPKLSWTYSTKILNKYWLEDFVSNILFFLAPTETVYRSKLYNYRVILMITKFKSDMKLN